MSNPRRSPSPFLNRRAALPALAAASKDHGPRLKKGETFHAPSTPPTEDDPRLSLPTLLRRSPTTPRSLEDVIAAGEKRMAAVISALERSISGLGSSSDSVSSPSPTPFDELPVPRGILDAHFSSPTDSRRPDIDIKKLVRTENHRHTSDSGLGTSISSGESVDSVQEEISPLLPGPRDTLGSVNPADTRSISSEESSKPRSKPTLSRFSYKRIHKLVLVPLYVNKQLTPFHPIVKEVPKLVVTDRVRCLRDIEKHFIFRAQHFALSPSAYIRFCEYAIHCIHATVPHLPQRDLALPSDRPYTNGYFLDLVEQVRQYGAAIGAARRARRSGQRQSDDLDYSSGEELVLEGGLSRNGCPAELVRKKKDGQLISLQTGAPYEPKPAMPQLKHAASDEGHEEGLLRSMARRKKDAPPMNINKKCSYCDKVFRRPCDLTKHEKTHSRPWKCTVPDCWYATRGWATEKERDRHYNDRHCTSPVLWECYFCTYKSKRESNVKQHMEAAHDWEYVRSKGNGKSKRSASRRKSRQDMQSNPASSMPTPATAPMPSPYLQPYPSASNLPTFSPNVEMQLDTPQIPPTDDFVMFPSPPAAPPLIPETNPSTYQTGQVDLSGFQPSLPANDSLDLIPNFDPNHLSVPSLSPATFTHDRSPQISHDNLFGLDWDSGDNSDHSPLMPHENFFGHDQSPQMPHENFFGSEWDIGYNGDYLDSVNMGLLDTAHCGNNEVLPLTPSGKAHIMFYTPNETNEG